MQPVDGAGVDETRNRAGAAFDQQTLEPTLGQRLDDIARRHMPVFRRQFDDFNAFRRRLVAGLDADGSDAAIGKAARRVRDARFGIDDHPHRTFALDQAHRQAGIIRHHRPGADHDRIDAGADAMQMGERRLAIDVARFTGQRRDPAVERLAQLRDH